MKYLLDTHVLIWHFNGSPALPENVIDIIRNGNLYISAVSLWEIALKMNVGKLDLLISLDDLLSAVMRSEITVLQIEDDFLKGLSALPPVHKDPFDRLLVSTASAMGLTLVTADENIQKYDVQWVW